MWTLIVMYILLIPCVALFICSKHKLGEDIPPTIAVKAICTTIIVVAAIILTAGISEPLHIYAILIAAGLTLGLVGDVTICQSAPGGFLFGMIFFGLGHFFYIAAFLQVSEHAVWAILVFAVIYLIFLYIIRKLVKMHPDFKYMAIPISIYGAVISAMVSLAVTVSFSTGYGLILLVGAALFAVSDGILAYGFVGKKSDRLDTFGLYCYFIGQSLFAVSLYCLC